MAIKIYLLLSLSLLLANSAYSGYLPTWITDEFAEIAYKPLKELFSSILQDGEPALEKVVGGKLAPPISGVSTPGLLVENGGFESHDDGWYISKAVKFIDQANFTVPSGSSAVELIAGRKSLLMQDILTVPNKEYQLSFIVGDAKNGCYGNMTVVAFASTTQYLAAQIESVGEGLNKPFNFSIKAVKNTTIIGFISITPNRTSNDGTPCGPVIDEVSVVPYELKESSIESSDELKKSGQARGPTEANVAQCLPIVIFLFFLMPNYIKWFF